jgi:hypothetical protein
MTEGWSGLVTRVYRSQKKFWRIRGIVSLVGYPEKTDRLEQRQAAGKTL